ncbi:MAG TPA: class I SAM-dependent methyltransferase [Fimbriimonadaceae bacterium]|nr:class I SAM-dependent methyltransferase [Fimbriimonadaceae bacterium]
MEPKIKIDLSTRLAAGEPVVLELGCGKAPQPGRIGVDRIDLEGVDIVADLEDGLSFLPDSSVDEIHCRSLLEHLDNFELFMREAVRVLKPNGTCHVFVPHFSNPYYYSDWSHRRFFGLYTFYYFVPQARQMGRTVPDYYTDIRIRILKQRLKFSSPFRIRRMLKKLLQWFFNLNPYLQEFYEEVLCWTYPCYGLEIVFTPDRPAPEYVAAGTGYV